MSREMSENVSRCLCGRSANCTSTRPTDPGTSTSVFTIQRPSSSSSPLVASSSSLPLPLAPPSSSTSSAAYTSSPTTSRPSSDALRSSHSRMPAHAQCPPYSERAASTAASTASNATRRCWQSRVADELSSSLSSTLAGVGSGRRRGHSCRAATASRNAATKRDCCAVNCPLPPSAPVPASKHRSGSSLAAAASACICCDCSGLSSAASTKASCASTTNPSASSAAPRAACADASVSQAATARSAWRRAERMLPSLRCAMEVAACTCATSFGAVLFVSDLMAS